jgi:uncharacterized protein
MIARQFVLEITKAANQGDAEAQYRLGLRYFNGKGVRRNYTKAAVWFRKAAKQGHIHAQYQLWWSLNWS